MPGPFRVSLVRETARRFLIVDSKMQQASIFSSGGSHGTSRTAGPEEPVARWREAASLILAAARLLPHGKDGNDSGGESRAALLRDLAELEEMLHACNGAPDQSFNAALARLEARLRSWQCASAAESAGGAAAGEPAGAPDRPARRGAPGAAPQGPAGAGETIPGESANRLKKSTRLSKTLSLSLAALEAGRAELPWSEACSEAARGPETLSAKIEEQQHLDLLKREIETVHGELEARLGGGLAAAAAEIAALKALVGNVAEQIGQAQESVRSRPPGPDLERELAKFAERLDRIAEKLASLAALEDAVADMSVQLAEIRRIVGGLPHPSGSRPRDLPPTCEAEQSIMREFAGLRALHEDAAQSMSLALAAVRESLGQVAGYFARLEAVAGKGDGDPPGGTIDASDPFAAIFAELTQRGDGRTLAMGAAAGGNALPQDAAATADAGGDVFKAEEDRQSGPSGDLASFLIEPGLGLSRQGETADQQAPGAPPCGSRGSAEIGTSRTDFIAAARRAARLAQTEMRGGRSGSQAGEARKLDPGATLLGRCRARIVAHKRALVLTAAVLLAAMGAVALSQALSRGNLASLVPGFSRQSLPGDERPKPTGANQAPAARPLASKAVPAMSPPDQAPAKGKWAGGPAAGNAPSETRPPAAAALLNPLAPEAQLPVEGGGGETLSAPRPIAGSDAVLANAMRPAAMALPAASAPTNAFMPGVNSLAPLATLPKPPSGEAPAVQASSAPPDASQQAVLARAEAGDAAAAFDIAVGYAEGSAAAPNYELAAHWYEKAARQGHAVAEYRLGSLYEKGLGVGKDMQRARELYQRAAERGNIRAMHNLGVLGAEGSDGKPNYTSAALWFGKAAEYGVRDSQYNFAVLLARGLGVPKDLVRSYIWFAIVAASGDGDAARKRDEIAARLTSSELAAANAAAAAFAPRPADRAANETLPRSAAQGDAARPADPIKPKVSGL